MQTPYNVFGYKIDLHFHDNKLAIEIKMLTVTEILTMK